MAIYYIDPMGTVNGTGTFASPWVLGTSTRSGLVSGDEIRILGTSLASLLTATTYTATVTNSTTLTLAAGGGSAWSAGSLGYLPAFDTFFRVLTVTGDVLGVHGSSILPINDSSVTSTTVRIFDTVNNIIPTRAICYIGGTSTNLSNITVSDCWVDATTRVTDGTVKTLISGTTNSNINVYFDITTRSNTNACTGWTLNLQNTHVISGGVTSGASSISGYFQTDNSVYNIKQIYSTGASPTHRIGYSGVGSTGLTLNITHLSSGGLSTNCQTQDLVFNILNFYGYASDYLFAASALTNCNNYVISIDYLGAAVVNGGYLIYTGSCGKGIINLNSLSDLWSASQYTGLIGGGFGEVSLNVAAGYQLKYNRKVSTQTTLSRGYGGPSQANNIGKMVVPAVNNLAGLTLTYPYYFGNFSFFPGSANSEINYKVPSIMEFVCPVTLNAAAALPNSYTYNINVLVTYKDGSEPIEILGIFQPLTSNNISANTCPQVTLDTVVYRTTGPSLKAYLPTRSSTIWRASTASPNAKAFKNIKIPVTAGTSYTITGYVRTDDAAYLAGDCRISIVFNNAELVGQNMTTACINAWEQFTLTFTATQTCEMQFVWEMYYSNGAKSYWLDDLTIS